MNGDVGFDGDGFCCAEAVSRSADASVATSQVSSRIGGGGRDEGDGAAGGSWWKGDQAMTEWRPIWEQEQISHHIQTADLTNRG